MKPKEFWKRVDQTGECWVWTGTLDTSGYGNFKIRGINVRAHRYAWELTHGKIPPGNGYHGTVVAHKCDIRACVNPAHLFLTDQRGNLLDCSQKGCSTKAFGPHAGRAVLNDRDVMEIREKAASGVNRAALAEEYGVCSQNIVDIVQRKIWKHLASDAGTVTRAPRLYNSKPNSGSFKKGSKGNPGAKPEKRTIDYAEAKRLHAAGHGIREVARLMATTHTTVRRALGG